MKYVLGIDLGTTNCSVTAIDENGKTSVIKNSSGEYITPSAVYFDSEPNRFIVGKNAKILEGSKNLVTLVKREMGKKKDEVRWNKFDRAFNPYVFWNKTFSPEEISSKILAQLKIDAERALGETVRDAVITCPGYFGQNEKEATRLAGELAGLNVLEVIPEPTAAALSYSTVSQKDSERVFVFDLGGGTFDITILELSAESDGSRRVETRICGGDPKLGGADWDSYLVDYIIERFFQVYKKDLAFESGVEAEKAYGKLRLDAEKAKKELSKSQSAVIVLEYGGAKLEETISRQKYAELTEPLALKCKSYCDNILLESNLSWNDIDTILMVGSMSNCPSIQDALKKWSGKEIAFNLVNPKTCVSEGAAIRAFAKICEKEGKSAVISSLEKKPDYAENSEKNLEQIESEESDGKRVFTRIAKTTSVLPGSICLKIKSRKTLKFVAFKMLERNRAYPCEFVRDFPIGRDNLPCVNLVVMEGEDENPDFCVNLGEAQLPLDGEHSAKDKIRVTFSADENGIIQVSALDLKTNRIVNAKIKRENAPSDEEIAQAKLDAEEDEFVLA